MPDFDVIVIGDETGNNAAAADAHLETALAKPGPLGYEVSMLFHEAVFAIRAGLTVDDVADAIHLRLPLSKVVVAVFRDVAESGAPRWGPCRGLETAVDRSSGRIAVSTNQESSNWKQRWTALSRRINCRWFNNVARGMSSATPQGNKSTVVMAPNR